MELKPGTGNGSRAVSCDVQRTVHESMGWKFQVPRLVAGEGASNSQSPKAFTVLDPVLKQENAKISCSIFKFYIDENSLQGSSREFGRAPTSEQLQRQRFRLCVPKGVEDAEKHMPQPIFNKIKKVSWGNLCQGPRIKSKTLTVGLSVKTAV